MSQVACIECASPATEQHHVIPKSMGGKATVPLCGKCHARVHCMSGTRRDDHKNLTFAGLLKSSPEYAERYACFLIWYTWSGQTNYPKNKWSQLIADFTGYDRTISYQQFTSMKRQLQRIWCEGDERLFDPLIDGLNPELANVVRDTIPQFLGT